jgi:hypothetical protein
VEYNQNSGGALHANTKQCQQEYAVWVSLRPKTAVKAISEREIEVQKRKDSTIAASDAARRARSDASYTNAKRHRRHGSRYENLEYSDKQSLSKNLDSSFLSVNEQGNIIPKTPEAALVAAQAYLHTTRPSPGDPREHMHRAAL